MDDQLNRQVMQNDAKFKVHRQPLSTWINLKENSFAPARDSVSSKEMLYVAGHVSLFYLPGRSSGFVH